jgi:hypothetical protein
VIETGIGNEEWTRVDDLKQDTPKRPHIDLRGIVRSLKDELRSSIASRTYIGDVLFFRFENLSGTEVTNNQFIVFHQHVLRLQVSVANLFTVQVEDRPQHLVDVALEFEGGWDRG